MGSYQSSNLCRVSEIFAMHGDFFRMAEAAARLHLGQMFHLPPPMDGMICY
jgi:hypothetical protein